MSAGGLCAVALLDGAPENGNKEAHLEMLTAPRERTNPNPNPHPHPHPHPHPSQALRKRKAGGPLSFSWIDATCHVGFAAHFELSEMDLPAVRVRVRVRVSQP